MAHLILRLGTAPVVPFVVRRKWSGGSKTYRKPQWDARRLLGPHQNWCAHAARAAARSRRSHPIDEVDALDCLTVSPVLLAFAARQARGVPGLAGQGSDR